MMRSIYCIAKNTDHLDLIIEELVHGGFSNKNISALFLDPSDKRSSNHPEKTKMSEGTAVGAGGGGLLGGTLGWLAGIGTLAIPGLGSLIAIGPLIATLGGAAIGATLGGFIGMLVGTGIPEYEAEIYEGMIRDGQILVSVDSENDEEIEKVKEVFQNAGATDISYSREGIVH